ncbi:MAG TPA: ABC transporter permease [Blastocatellia bacterium]
MEDAFHDFRFALRLLVKDRATTVVALMALAIGIGASTAIFSVADSVMFKPLPYANPGRLAMIWQTNPEIKIAFDRFPVSAPKFLDWQKQAASIEKMAAFSTSPFNIEHTGEPEKLGGAVVTADFFSVLGVNPIAGRTFTADEVQPGHNLEVVISYGLWQRRFNRDPGIVGRSLTLNGQDYTVVGVMPAGFSFPRGAEMPPYFQIGSQTEIWSPLTIDKDRLSDRNTNVNDAVIARLKPGLTIAQAQNEMNVIAARLIEQYPNSDAGFGALLVPLRDQVVGSLRTALLVLMAAVGFVLLIACANVANLLLARGSAREKEIAIRSALGANRRRIVRQLLTESVVLSLTGGILGLALASVGVSSLIAITPDKIPGVKDATLDARVLSFSILVSLLTGIVFGVVPAFQGSKADLNEPLKEGGRGSTAGRHLTQDVLVVAEVALALVLLVGAGLMIRSFVAIESTGPGLNPDGVLTMKTSIPDTNLANFQKELVARAANLPGVESVSVCSDIPLTGAEDIEAFTIEGRPAPKSFDEIPLADYSSVSPGYFKCMGIPLVAGREFADADNETAPNVAVVNQALADEIFRGEDPIGKRITVDGDHWITIVGIVGDVRHTALDMTAKPQWYQPFLQRPESDFGIVVKTAPGLDPRTMAEPIRTAVWSINPDLPLYQVQTMEQVISVSISQRRLNMLLLVIFAACALILAAVGIYGIVSYGVSQRTHEIGIRMALGAQSADVLAMVVGQSMKLALSGLAIGLAGSLMLTRLMASLLYGITTRDPLTLIVVPLVLGGVALAASYIPARRATSVDSIVALRYE